MRSDYVKVGLLQRGRLHESGPLFVLSANNACNPIDTESKANSFPLFRISFPQNKAPTGGQSVRCLGRWSSELISYKNSSQIPVITSSDGIRNRISSPIGKASRMWPLLPREAIVDSARVRTSCWADVTPRQAATSPRHKQCGDLHTAHDLYNKHITIAMSIIKPSAVDFPGESD